MIENILKSVISVLRHYQGEHFGESVQRSTLSILRNIYYAFVYPHILYGIEIYANTSSTHLKN